MNSPTMNLPKLFICLLLFGCNISKPKLVGNDRDVHGCIVSAGYQYSELKKECVRPFEISLQLYNDSHTYISSVIFSEDSTKAEIFSPEGHFLMNKVNDSVYQVSGKKDQKISLVKSASYWEFHKHANVYKGN